MPAQVANLYNNCLKLASENKISSKNTWALPLIDHISDLVQPSTDEGQTNFQRASVTLDAGVVIYAHRVDSVHVDAFRVLGGLSRAGPSAQNGAHMPCMQCCRWFWWCGMCRYSCAVAAVDCPPAHLDAAALWRLSSFMSA